MALIILSDSITKLKQKKSLEKLKCEIKLSKKQLDDKSYVYVHLLKCFCTLNNERSVVNSIHVHSISPIILLYEKFLQFDWLRAVVFQLNSKYLHVKIANLLQVVVEKQITA